jgi:hypothetical protein
VCAGDPNAGARAQAKERWRDRVFTYKSNSIGFFNKETTWDKNRKFITGMGLSRDLSDVASAIYTARGKGLYASQELSKKFYTSQAVDEGGRARNYKQGALTKFLAGQAQVDMQLARMMGIGKATAYTGIKRLTANRLAKNRANLGLPPTFGPAVMMPPKGDTTMANLGLGLTAASIAFPFMAPALGSTFATTTGALTATGTAVAGGLAAGGSALYGMGSQPYWES